MHFQGILIGICTFLIIGLFHPLVIKVHYKYGTSAWWGFLLLGLVACVFSIFIANTFLSTVTAVLAFSSFWTIGELFAQEKRVKRGWFPANPRRQKP